LCKRQGIQTYIAEIAEDKLERMRNNPKVAAIIEGRRHELKGEIDDKAIDYVVKEYISATINRACNQPVFHILKMAQLGIAIYLVTDQETSMIVSETNLVKSISGRIISKPTLIFQLNDLLNEILEKSGLPTFTLDKYLTSFRDYWEKIEERADLTEAEREVIRLIRERDYQRVTAQVKGGEIIRVEREEDLPTREQDKLEELILNAIREGDHQTITLQKCDGKLMRINRKESIKLGKVTEKP
jgi:DNA-binding protein YbaB